MKMPEDDRMWYQGSLLRRVRLITPPNAWKKLFVKKLMLASSLLEEIGENAGIQRQDQSW
jgi:hypothetical protein